MTSRDMPRVIAKSERWKPIAELADRFQDLPIWRVLVQHVPTAEPDMLEHLASELDLLETEAWQRAQTDKERRFIIDQAHYRNRTRGTDAGLRLAAAEAGAEIRKIWAPPSKFFPSAALTPAQRNAWLSQHPELRIYPRRLPGQQEVFHAGGLIGGRFFPARSSALVRSRLRATLVKNGVETELETIDWQLASVEKQAVNEIVQPGRRGHAYFGCGVLRFVAQTDATVRRFVIREIVPYDETTAQLGIRTATPGLAPIDADGEMVAEIRFAPSTAYFGRGFLRWPVPLQAELAMYRRIRLFDPTVPAVRARASAHLGYTRLGMPPHTAEIQVALFGKRHLRAQGRFPGLFFAAGDREPLQRLLASLRLAKRLSDKILIDTSVYRPVKAGQFLAGSVVAGSVTQQ